MNLFFYDYYFFKKIIANGAKKMFNIFLFLLFILLLINLLDQYSQFAKPFNVFFRLTVVFFIFYLSLEHSSWLAYFLSSLIYLLLIQFFYLTFSLKTAFLLWFIAFFFVKDLLNYTFNFFLFKLQQHKIQP